MSFARWLCLLACAAIAHAQDPIPPTVLSIDPLTGRAIGTMNEIWTTLPAPRIVTPPPVAYSIGPVESVPDIVNVPLRATPVRGNGGWWVKVWDRPTRLTISDQLYGYDVKNAIPIIYGPVIFWGNPEPGRSPFYGLCGRRADDGASLNGWTMIGVSFHQRFRGAAVLNDCLELFNWQDCHWVLTQGYAVEFCNDNRINRLTRSVGLSADPDVATQNRTMSGGRIVGGGIGVWTDNPDQASLLFRGQVTDITISTWFGGNTGIVADLKRLPMEVWGTVGGRANVPENIVFDGCVYEGAKDKPRLIRCGRGVPLSAVKLRNMPAYDPVTNPSGWQVISYNFPEDQPAPPTLPPVVVPPSPPIKDKPAETPKRISVAPAPMRRAA